MDRFAILSAAEAATRGARQKEYGSFYNNMLNTAAMFNAYVNAKYPGTGLALTAEDTAQFMVLHKMVRTMNADAVPTADTFIDEAGYAAAAGEFALQEPRGVVPDAPHQ